MEINRIGKLGGVNDSRRLDYIDILRGITIFCIIWCHTDSPSADHEWSLGTIGNIFFFILSGFFFKPLRFKEFLQKKFKTIIIPLLIFYVLSVPFRFLVDVWDYRSIFAFDWNRIWDIFKIVDRSDYLSVNVPLWFLLTLFVIQLISNYLFRLPKLVIALLAIVSFVLKYELLNWPTLFIFNNSLYWFGFFATGYLIGRPLVKLLEVNSNRHKLLVFRVILFMFSFLWIDILERLDFMNLFIHLRLHSPLIGLVISIICAVLLIPIINLINIKFPFIIGKSISKKTINLTSSLQINA